MKSSNYWKVKPIKLHFNLDSDRDGVPDWKDCEPFNPRKQHRIIICPVCGEERSHFAKGLCKNCYHKEYRRKPKAKEYQKEYRQRPEVKEHTREYHKEYYQRPEVKEHIKEYYKEYRQREYYEEFQAMGLLRRKIRRLLIFDREGAIKLIEEMKKVEGKKFTNKVLEGV